MADSTKMPKFEVKNLNANIKNIILPQVQMVTQVNKAPESLTNITNIGIFNHNFLQNNK